MRRANATRGLAARVIAAGLFLGLVGAGPSRAGEAAPPPLGQGELGAPIESPDLPNPAAVEATRPTSIPQSLLEAPAAASRTDAQAVASVPPEPAADFDFARVSSAAEGGVSAPGPRFPEVTPFEDEAGQPEEAASRAAARPDAEARPEGTEEAPVLVGPDDDRLLLEVEKHVNIVPAGPAIRIAEPTYDIPLELNAKVLDYVEIFQTTRRRSFEAGLARARKYESLMKPMFAELGIPTDLYYLALIESGYNPKAYSYARAMGIWQFISSTGRLYGLRRTDWIDERRDPEKATRAAARHLKDLYDELGSWPLALAAYNAGKGRVQRAIAKAGTTDFWTLDLPGQTRNYVPAFYAALIISKDPERYGFQPEYEELEATETVDVSGGTRLSLVAALCRTSTDTIQNLNPELRKSAVPPGGKYALKIPAGQLEELSAGLAKVPTGKVTAVSHYRVAPGDTLFSIAQRFGTTAEAIREANQLKDSDIGTGQRLTIPGQRVAEAPIPRAPGRIVVSSAIPESYRVKTGDNPWAIARRFGIALDDLLAWNGLESDSVLSVGQALALREPTAGSPSSGRSTRAARTYEVRKGDNLWQISQRFATSIEELKRLNGFAAGHDLKPGDRVILP